VEATTGFFTITCCPNLKLDNDDNTSSVVEIDFLGSRRQNLFCFPSQILTDKVFLEDVSLKITPKFSSLGELILLTEETHRTNRLILAD
jgi:hypothetical protein